MCPMLSEVERITEVKRHPDGREVRFDLQLIQRYAHLIVARFVHPMALQRDSFTIDHDAISYGFFWRWRPYVMYRMLDASGRLIANRFDVVEDVRLAERTVAYTDLFLDLWVGPDGTPHLEDEDEVTDAGCGGLLSRSQLNRIEETKELLLRRHRVIATEAARLLS